MSMALIHFVTLLMSSCTVICQKEVEEHLPIPVVKKCVCDGLTVKTENGCESKNYPQHVFLWNEVSATEIDINLSLNKSFVKVEPLKDCPSGTSRKQYQLEAAFISLQDGKIIYQSLKSEHYCIDFVLTSDENLVQVIDICEEDFLLRTCCELNKTVSVGGVCLFNEAINANMLFVQWLDGFNRHVSVASCSSKPLTIENLPLLNNESDLKQLLAEYKVWTDGQYCVNLYEEDYQIKLGIVSCKPPPMNRIPICCSMHEAFNLDDAFSMGCVPSTDPYQFPDEFNLPQQRIMWHSMRLDCSDFQILDFPESEAHNFSSEGDLVTPSGSTLPFDKYCLGVIIHDNKTFHSGLVCSRESAPANCTWRYDVQSVCLAISSFFIILTLVVYLSISDLRRRIAGVCLISELISLLIAQITLIIMFNKEEWTAGGCLSAGSVELIFVLASFFWLNVMCFDVWSTFRVLRSFSEKVFNIGIFAKYSLYAWGLPLLIAIIGIILQKLHVKYSLNFTPEIGCFFTDIGEYSKEVHWIYLYGPILVLLLANTGFFFHLAVTLVRGQKERRRLIARAKAQTSSEGNSSCPNVEDLKLYAKLFVIMGLPWLLELFTSFASKDILCYIWFLDLFNSLRGILIFVIFVCKRNMRDKIMKAWFPPAGSDIDSSSMRSRKTSVMSLTSWLPSRRGRKSSTSTNQHSEVVMSQLKGDH